MNNNDPLNGLPYVPGAPEPEKRRAMAWEALKGSKIITPATKRTETEEVLARLDHYLNKTFAACVPVVRQQRRDPLLDEKEHQAGVTMMVMGMLKEHLASEDKYTLHAMLCVVLTKEMQQRLEDVN